MTTPLAAIDVHGHYGVNYGASHTLIDAWRSGGPEVIVRRANAVGIALTIVSPLRALFPRGRADACAGNAEALRLIPAYPELGFWAVLDPTNPATFAQVAELLTHPRCFGVKIHPEEHRYPIKTYGEQIFSFAAEHRAIILTHSGEPNSLPADFVPLARAFAEVPLILAHHGCGHDGDPTHQVRAIQQIGRDQVFTDTSSASNITPGQIEWAVAEIGPERLLFGTDTPLYSTAMQRARIDHAEISPAARRLILHDNAARLLGLPLAEAAGNPPRPSTARR